MIYRALCREYYTTFEQEPGVILDFIQCRATAYFPFPPPEVRPSLVHWEKIPPPSFIKSEVYQPPQLYVQQPRLHWQDYYGHYVHTPAVPEPASLSLILLGLIFFRYFVRNKHA